MKDRQVVIVIDMANDFIQVDGDLPIKQAFDIVYPMAAMIRHFRNQVSNGGIIFVCDSHPRDSEEFKTYPPHCIEYTWGAEIVKELNPQFGDLIIKKDDFSLFTNKDIIYDGFFGDSGIYRAYVAGVATEICVKESLIGTKDRNGKEITNLITEVNDVRIFSNLIKPINAEAGFKALDQIAKAGVRSCLYTSDFQW